jgi:hypothetical protein
MLRPTHNFRFGYPHDIWGEVQIVKLLIMQAKLLKEIESTTQRFGVLAILYTGRLLHRVSISPLAAFEWQG